MNNSIYTLFKAYDVRGTYPVINEKIAYWLGFGFVELILKAENLPLEVNIIHDCRNSSPSLYTALNKGILDAGGKTRLLGLGSTDLLYAACQLFKNPGIMVTASHNPKNDNGFKLVKQAPQMLGLSTGLDKVRDFIILKIETDANNYSDLEYLEEDISSKNELIEFFKAKLVKIGKTAKINDILSKKDTKLKIIIDCGNAMGGYVMPWIAELYPSVEFVDLYWNLDGNFPHHQADPLNFETLRDLQAKIIETKADLGIALDGDADRVYFLDSKAKIMMGDEIVAILAKSFLKDYFEYGLNETNPVILFDQRSRRCVSDFILEAGGVAVPTSVGHIHFKNNMLKYNALYGGEVSGHHYFKDFGMDSGAMGIVAFLKILATEAEVLERLHNRISNYYFTTQGEINFHLEEGHTFEKVKNKLVEVFNDAEFNFLDGVTLFYPTWKANIRMSNTEPLLRLNLETLGTNKVNEKVDEIKSILGLR